jgi:hypothetical protein
MYNREKIAKRDKVVDLNKGMLRYRFINDPSLRASKSVSYKKQLI